jgi:hypothetical protein
MATLPERPEDLDAGRAAVVSRELVTTASAYLTQDVAMSLPFETLGPFKTLLRRFFSPMSWSQADAEALSDLVTPHVANGWWEHDLGSGLTLAHGINADQYELWIRGGGVEAPSIFTRVFDGPVVPEATPHPRKVKFNTGGAPAPGTWYRVTDPDPPDDERVRRLFAEPDITDVMVAGDFVTVGIGPKSSWEVRLEPLLGLVTELFSAPDGAGDVAPAKRTRDELLHEAGSLHPQASLDELHLLDPDDPVGRATLQRALEAADPALRRIAVAILVESDDPEIRLGTVAVGRGDNSLLVRRTAVDAAADAADEALRPALEDALGDTDPWTRWKAVRAIAELGLEPSRDAVAALADDPDFQVRFEVAGVLRAAASE